MALRVLALALILLALTASRSGADHERFIVGEMRNVDPSVDIITSTSGACIPSHDRERLDCYFTSFGLWKAQTEEQLKRQYDDLVAELQKDPAKQIQELKTSFCADKTLTQPDPLRLNYNAWARTFFASSTFRRNCLPIRPTNGAGGSANAARGATPTKPPTTRSIV